MVMWERRAELEGFAAVMEAIRNSAPGLEGRAIAGLRDYGQIPELAERSKLRVKNFFCRSRRSIERGPFRGRPALPLPILPLCDDGFRREGDQRHRSGRAPPLKRWYDAVSSRPSMAA